MSYKVSFLDSIINTAVPLLQVCGSTALIFFSVLVMLRIVGYRMLGQLSPFDFMTVLLMSGVLQNAMVGDNNTVTGGLVGAMTLVFLNSMTSRNKWLARIFIKSRVQLIDNGSVIQKALKSENITIDHLMASLRVEGITSISDVKEAYLEASGKVSLISMEADKSNTDPVTGLQQYWMMQNHLNSILAQEGKVASTMMVDINGMNQINSQYGYHVGNSVITEVGKQLESIIRPGDRLYRFSEDRFVLAVPVIKENAAKLGERIRSRVSSEPLFLDSHDVAVTVTISVADFKKDDKVDESIKILKAGISAGKHNGGNCIISCEGKDNNFDTSIVIAV